MADNSQQTDFDVLIVGGGMVGATLACLLAEQPLRVGLLDKSPLQAAPPEEEFSARVSALTLASQRLFDSLGLWQAMADVRSCDYQDMHVWDADGTGSIHFSAADVNAAALGTIIENDIVLSVLQQRLRAVPNLQLLPTTSVQAISAEPFGGYRVVTDDAAQLSTQLLVAADGANSPLREMARFRTREWDYGHQAIVTTVHTERPHQRTAWQRFMDTGPLAFLPLQSATLAADETASSIVWSTQPEQAAELMAMDDAAFCRALTQAFEATLGQVEDCARRFSFPLRQRHAIDYVQPGIALIGDAAHTIHPLAGQGVNLGLLDAAALASELARGNSAGRKPGDLTVLKRYQRARVGHNLSMMWLMEGFKHLFAEQALPVRWLRNVGLSSVDGLPLIKQQLARKAMGLDAV